MVQTPQNPKDVTVPGLIGGFNIPKAVIENKVDILTFLEFMVRKEIITAEELDEVRAAVVAHLNAAYPELALSYATPDELKQAASKKPAAPTASATAAAPPPPAKSSPQQPVSTATAALPPDAIVADNPGDALKKASELSNQTKQASQGGGANAPLYYEAPRPKFIK